MEPNTFEGAMPPPSTPYVRTGTALRAARSHLPVCGRPLWHAICSCYGMADIKPFSYHYVICDDHAAAAAGILNALDQAGIDLIAFSVFPHGPGKCQLDLVPENAEALLLAAQAIGLTLSGRKTGFLIQDAGRPSTVAEAMDALAAARINVVSVQAISAGAGRYGALLWVKAPEVSEALNALSAEALEAVDEASVESFPASDSPALIPA